MTCGCGSSEGSTDALGPHAGAGTDPKFLSESEPFPEETTFLGFVEQDESQCDECSEGHAAWDARLLPFSPSEALAGDRLLVAGDVEEVKLDRGIF